MTVSARQVLHSGPVEHLVFSDGLASVSVFVEIGREQRAEQVSDDAATIGSSSAYSTVVQGYRVTAVGEVPPDTVRAIAQSIRAAGPEPSMPNRCWAWEFRRATAPRTPARSSIHCRAARAASWAITAWAAAAPAWATPAQRPVLASPAAGGPGTTAFGAAPGAARAGIERARSAAHPHADTADPCRVRVMRGHAQ
jgi:hypothetical protein